MAGHDPTPILMFAAVIVALLLGYPVALTLSGVGLLFAVIGMFTGAFNLSDLGFLGGRMYGILINQTLIAVPLFVFMGVILERARIAELLLKNISALLADRPAGLTFAVLLVGVLLAASTGIVGATVVTLGLMSLPTMLRDGYDSRLATGTVCATGTLGQIIPPSIALVLLGDALANAYQTAQLSMGVLAPKTVSVGDLFAGAIIPGLLLVLGYGLWIVIVATLRPSAAPPARHDKVPPLGTLVVGLIAPLTLIVAVLGSILAGAATPTEAAGVGALGALVLAVLRGEMSMERLHASSRSTLSITSMVFFILIGASIFSLVFRSYGGDELVRSLFDNMPGGTTTAMIIVMLVIFVLGFILDFIEITFIVVPIVGPVLLAMGVDPVWLGIMIAVNLQTSFLTPPFGFALFYLRGVMPAEIPTTHLYQGVVPFIILQLGLLGILAAFPALATWLPNILYGP